MIGPPATALRLTKRISRSLVVAAVIGLATTWLGILLAYDSGAWASGRDSLPVSFCIVGLIFVGLIAWDTQKIKRLSAQATDETSGRRIAILGSLMLYLDFINLFLFLLRIFGRRR